MAQRSQPPRSVLGVAFTTQSVVLALVLLAVAALVGLAVLNWLERLA